jgi:hypothetical protein
VPRARPLVTPSALRRSATTGCTPSACALSSGSPRISARETAGAPARAAPLRGGVRRASGHNRCAEITHVAQAGERSGSRAAGRPACLRRDVRLKSSCPTTDMCWHEHGHHCHDRHDCHDCPHVAVAHSLVAHRHGLPGSHITLARLLRHPPRTQRSGRLETTERYRTGTARATPTWPSLPRLASSSSSSSSVERSVESGHLERRLLRLASPGGLRSSPGWTRTNNPSVNSRMLCQLSYRGRKRPEVYPAPPLLSRVPA